MAHPRSPQSEQRRAQCAELLRTLDEAQDMQLLDADGEALESWHEALRLNFLFLKELA